MKFSPKTSETVDAARNYGWFSNMIVLLLKDFLCQKKWIFLYGAYSLIFKIPVIGFTEGTVDPIDFLRIVSGMLILSFLLPIYFKFGQLAVRYFLFTIMGLGVVLQVVLLIMISVVSDKGGSVINLIMTCFTQFTVINRNLTLFGISLVIFIASYIASLTIYSRKNI
ncbi:MAG: ABC-2 transporter permease [Spirochaetales bacterium]|nr:ABC-2 transporter permease [Spirochaetales bacterium]